MQNRSSNFGLVVSGGKSTRMGLDKSLLKYHLKPQRYHIYDLMEVLCQRTFISCSPTQVNTINKAYQSIVDLPSFSGIGPMAALLTAFAHYPQNDFLVIGCDYPYLTEKDLLGFLACCEKRAMAAAFYHEKEKLYEPLLAWYSHRAHPVLLNLFEKREFALQYFLQAVDARKYCPAGQESMHSIDTPEAMAAAKVSIQNKIRHHAID